MDRKDGKVVSRRGLLKGAAGLTAGAAAVAAGLPGCGPKAGPGPKGAAATKGRINHSVCQWCWGKVPLETLARECAAMGVKSIELVEPKDWPILKKHGLICALTSSHGFVKGFNDTKNHAMCIQKITEAVDATSAEGWPNVITFSGFRNGIADDVGLKNCIDGLKKVVAHAEKKKVTLCFEVLNSRVNVEMKGHPGYMADSVEFVAEVCQKVGSERLKILFDIYHVQVMQGDVIVRIRKYKDLIGHYHVAGVPGRNEMDETQELYYPAIMRAVAETGFTAYAAQEFIPTRDPIQSLWEGVRLCDV